MESTLSGGIQTVLFALQARMDIEAEEFDNISKIIDGKEKLCESTRINAEGTFNYSTNIPPKKKCA